MCFTKSMFKIRVFFCLNMCFVGETRQRKFDIGGKLCHFGKLRLNLEKRLLPFTRNAVTFTTSVST